MKRNNTNRFSGMTVLLSLMLVCALGLFGFNALSLRATGASAEESAEPTVAAPTEDTSPAVYVAQKNANSVVGIITSTQTWSQVGGVIDQDVAQGSGVVIADGGYVLTNYHVIENGDAYKVLMPSGDKVEATIAGTDSATDLAVLKVTDADAASQLVPVEIGSSENLVVGSTVVAIGNPGGEVLANTVTQGIISALERTSMTSSNTTRRINYIQHDAAINNGNSGGGLFNINGELIGINTLKMSGSAFSSVTFEGLGFAIPVDTVWNVASQLIENGKVSRPGLGVTVSNVEGPDEPLTATPPASVMINTINEGSAAAAAGLQQYDFIYEVDGKRVTSRLDLTGILDEHEVGDTISITVVRYNNARMQTYQNADSYYGFPYGFGFGGYGFGGYNYGGNDGNGGSSNGGQQSFATDGGYQFVTVDVTLQTLESDK